MLELFLICLLGLIIGFSLSTLGSGGSILAIPILIHLVGLNFTEAMPISLLSVGIVSLFATLRYIRKGKLNWRFALSFAPVCILGALCGVKLSYLPFVDSRVKMLCFGVLMLISAVNILFFKNIPAASPSPAEAIGGKFSITYEQFFLYFLGFLVGILTGFVGVGGGFLLMPAFLIFSPLSMIEASSTSLVVISLNSFASFFAHLGEGPILWQIAVPFCLFALLGTIFGTHYAHRINVAILRRSLGVLLAVIGCYLLTNGASY